MLACARIGAIHSVVFGGFSAESLRDRILDCGSEAGRSPPTAACAAASSSRCKHTADDALKDCPGVEDRRRRCSATGKDVAVHRGPRPAGGTTLVRGEPLALRAASRWTPRTRSSSSTPRARPASRRACCTPPAATWSTPRSRTSWSSTSARRTPTGAPPTSAGSRATATSSTVRSRTARRASCSRASRTYPDWGRFWDVVDKYGVTILYTAPTAIRAIAREGDEPVEDAQPQVAAPARHGGRADQPGGLALVPPGGRRRALPRRRHLVADGDGRHPDHAAARRHRAEAGVGDAAVLRRASRRWWTIRARCSRARLHRQPLPGAALARDHAQRLRRPRTASARRTSPPSPASTSPATAAAATRTATTGSPAASTT